MTREGWRKVGSNEWRKKWEDMREKPTAKKKKKWLELIKR